MSFFLLIFLFINFSYGRLSVFRNIKIVYFEKVQSLFIMICYCSGHMETVLFKSMRYAMEWPKGKVFPIFTFMPTINDRRKHIIRNWTRIKVHNYTALWLNKRGLYNRIGLSWTPKYHSSSISSSIWNQYM